MTQKSTIISDHHLRNFVGGSWVSPIAGRARPNINPANVTDHIGDFPESAPEDVRTAVDAARAAFGEWKSLGPIRRADYLSAVGRLVEERSEDLTQAITREQGKLLREAREEVRRALAILEFTAGEGRRLNGVTTPAEEPRTFSYTFRSPIGVVGLITPWNFPLAIPVWKVAPALLAGCTAILKPSPLTPLAAALLTELCWEAGLPPGVLNLVQGDVEAGEALVANPAVAGISFTGSVPVGIKVHAAGTDRLMRTQLELGGKNAVVVLDDADLDSAAEAIASGAFGNAGQRCSATSRAIVHVNVRDALLDRLVARASGLRVGPGADPASDVGPVISAERMADCLAAVAGAQAAGAKLCCGGGRAGEGGHFVQPTVLADVPWDCELAQREIFGPVLAVIAANGFDEAIKIANSVEYGMSATIFTRDPARIFEAVERFDAGMLHVNRPRVGSFAHLPHVGAKLSQFGPPECGPQVWDFYTE